MFKLNSGWRPRGDQPKAISQLVAGVKAGIKDQVLLGVTGSGKTYTIANVIQETQLPTLVISPNKTLAAQLYQEFREFFPNNAVSYFVSYYDYYQPEAYLPQTDTYIEKETEINEEIDKLRLATTANLMAHKDVIVVASVSCIYNLGSPQQYQNRLLNLKRQDRWQRKKFLTKLTELHYLRNDYEFRRGTFRVRDEVVDIYPAYGDQALRVILENGRLKSIAQLEPISGQTGEKLEEFTLYPAKHYLTDPQNYQAIFTLIKKELDIRVAKLEKENKFLEARRLRQRTEYDLQMIEEIGYVNGIENYSRYFDGRQPGEPPYCLLDYFPKEFLLVIDESHLTIPQIRGMYRGDRARKLTLIDYGFRLPSALDNRPLTFSEFRAKLDRVIYTSATPGDWELKRSAIIEQLIRPTGLVDPEIEIRPTNNQIFDLIDEITKRVSRGERVLVTTLTKRTAEELADYLAKRRIKTHYLHSEIETLDRTDILEDLRQGVYDVVVGINLLREGLDLPEVSLVAILGADKEGFLRSETSLIQTMGRAARHLQGKVIMYADRVTGSMNRAINEVNRRRQIQLTYNQKHQITPKSISKPIRAKVVKRIPKEARPKGLTAAAMKHLERLDPDQLTPAERQELIKRLKKAMKLAVDDLDFEAAAVLRDKTKEVVNSLYG